MRAAEAGQRHYSLVYTSEARTPFTDDQLSELLAQARDANEAAGITGILLYRGGRFVQFLEGPEGAVRRLMSTIADDPRHEKVRLLIDGHPETRQFPAWTMGYEPLRVSSTEPPAGFRDTFDDLESVDDADAVLRAARELSIWFRARTAPRTA